MKVIKDLRYLALIFNDLRDFSEFFDDAKTLVENYIIKETPELFSHWGTTRTLGIALLENKSYYEISDSIMGFRFAKDGIYRHPWDRLINGEKKQFPKNFNSN